MKKLLLSALWLWLGSGGANAQTSAATSQPLAGCAPVAGLVAYYPFDESQGSSPQDASGQLAAGTLSGNGNNWKPTGGYNGGGALSLTGSEYVDLPLAWRPTRFTFSFWLKPTSRTNWSQITGSKNGWGEFLFHSAANGSLYVGTDIATRIELTTPELVEIGKWQHFAFTFDNGTGIIYKNGVALAPPRSNMTLPQTWPGIELGAPASALYDELRVYNRALSAAEVGALARCPGAATYLPPSRPNANPERNWTLERMFDENGNVVGEGKQFVDVLGLPTQTQTRDPASGQAFASQTVYSSAGQPVLQTLAAPTNNQDFSYKTDFVTAGGTPYGPVNFEQGKASAPDPVDATLPGTLGYFFSKQNALEPLTPSTSYPYSLSEPYPGPATGVRRAAAPGDELRMGKGRELRTRTLPVRKEFDLYNTMRPHFLPGSPSVTLEYQATKAVSINTDGRESIAVSNKEGQLLLTCLSGPQYPAVAVYGFLSAEASNRFDANAPTYQDVHIPAAGRQDVKFTMGSEASAGGQISIINLLTNARQDYNILGRNDGTEPELHVQLDPGFYRIISIRGTQWLYYEAHYGEFSYLYYDEAGRVIATVAPGGVPGTNLLRNAGFEQDPAGPLPISNWQNAGNPDAATYTQTGGGGNPAPHGGQQYGVHWTGQSGGHGAYTYQVVQNLPNGLYTARAWVKNTGIQQDWPRQTASLLAKEYNTAGSQLEADIPVTYAWGDWVQVQVTNIPVTNGQCTVGIYSISPKDDWVIFDDLEFVRQTDGTQPTLVTRKTYDTAGNLLSTESNDEGRTDYVYARDGRLRFSQSPTQRPTGRFSYANYDEVGRIVESGEYAASENTGVAFESHATYSDKLANSWLLEAEAATIQNSNGNQPNYNVSNASGTSDAGWLTSVGNYVRWTFFEPVAGRYELHLRYSSGGTDVRTMQLLVNGSVVQELRLPGTGDWNTFATLHAAVTLASGTNTVQVQVGGGNAGWVDLDYLRVVQPVNTNIFQEAESAEFTNSYNWVPNSHQAHGTSNSSGGQVVGFLVNPGDFVRFRVEVARAGTYQLAVGYGTGQPDTRTMSVLVNEAPATQLAFPSTGGWGNYSSVSQAVTLRAGVNVVQVLYGPADNGWVDLDWLSLTASNQLAPLSSPLSVHDILEDRTRTGGLAVANCSQRQQAWYDTPWEGTDAPLGSRAQQFVAGMLAKTQNDNVTSWYSYDELGRVSWVVQNVPALAGQTTKTIDYTYDLGGNILQSAYQKNQSDSFYHYYTYDAAQRLVKVETSPDGSTRTLQAEHSYYLNGALKRTQLAGNLQGLDYTYTLEGALKNLNHVNQSLEPGHDSPQTTGFYKDLFALALDYYDGDYRSRNLDVMLPTSTGVATRYDGTIQGAAWRTAASPDVHRMVYSYDTKGQLLDARYGKLGISGTYYYFQPSAALREGGLTYDLNGNLQTLRRADQNGLVADNFSYVYKANSNQLKEVHTGGPAGTTVLDYDYNEQGQPTRQRDEQGQRYFSYDARGKTTGVYFDAARQQPLATFAYDDRGFRLSKTSSPQGTAAPASTTYYVRDLVGNVLATYEKSAPWNAVQRTEVPLYGAGRLGTLTRLDDGTLDYRYELNDHLGSARVVFHRPTTVVHLATLEPNASSQEEQAFTNVANTRYLNNAGYQRSTAVARLGSTNGLERGPGKVLTVQKGDTITFSAYAWLTQALGVQAPAPSARATRALPLAGLAGLALTPPAGGWVPREQDGRPGSNPLTRLGLGVGFTLGTRAAMQATRPTPAAAPQAIAGTGNARLHYVVRDASGTPKLDAYQYANARTPGTWQALQVGLRLQQGGTVEVSVETDGAASPDVYFDNVRVEHTGGLIVQEQHQYAYGSPLPGLSYNVGPKLYRQGFQGQFAERDPELGLSAYEARNYAGRLGRWLSPDPVPRANSPYVGMGNNPVSFSDPDGKDVIVLNYTNGAMGAGHMALLVQDRAHPGGWLLYSKNGTHWLGGIYGPAPADPRDHAANQIGVPYKSLQDFYAKNAEFGEDASQYDRALYIKTTAAEEKAMVEGAKSILREPYDVQVSSCQTMVQAALMPLHIGFFWGSGAKGYNTPNANFTELRAQLERLDDPVFKKSFWAVGFGQPREFQDYTSIIRTGIRVALSLKGVHYKNPKFR